MIGMKLHHVRFAYPNGFLAIDDVSMEFAPGEKVAIIGQNGAGKTTLVKMMNGLLRPTEGDIEIDGQNIAQKTTAQISKRVGYVFQNPGDQLFNRTVYDEIAYTLRHEKVDPAEVDRRVHEAAQLCGLEEELRTNPYDLPFSLRKFVTIAIVLANECEFVILDEPTAGQDAFGMARLAKIIDGMHASGKTVLTITHDMDFVIEHFQRIIVMCDKKKIGDGTKNQIFWDFDLLDRAALKQPVVAALASHLGVGSDVVSLDDFLEAVEAGTRGIS